MKIEERTVDYAISFEKDNLEGNGLKPFKCDNEELKEIILKSLDYLKSELSKDLELKEKEDEDSKAKFANYLDYKEDDERIMFFFNAAMEGCASAQHILATIYYDGKTFEPSNGELRFLQNRELSALWEFLAAMNGHTYAQYNFADNATFSMGKYDTVSIDIKDALRLLELAANQDYTNAQYILVGIYLNRKNHPFWEQYKDIQKGIKYGLMLREKGIYDFEELIEKYVQA